jgi:hypothetical protein
VFRRSALALGLAGLADRLRGEVVVDLRFEVVAGDECVRAGASEHVCEGFLAVGVLEDHVVEGVDGGFAGDRVVECVEFAGESVEGDAACRE